MINKKAKALGSNRSCIRELFEYGKNLAKEKGADSVFDYSLGNPSIPAPDCVKDELIRLINEVPAAILHGYTSAEGDASVRECIAAHIRDCYGAEAYASFIYMTAGAAAALTSTIGAITSEGEEVILLAPYFPEYKVFAEHAGAKVREVSCQVGSFRPDIEAISAAITEKCAAIIINSPNNPTGAVYTEEDIQAIAALLREKSRIYGKPIYIIADEPYRELVYGNVTVPYIPNYYDNTIVCYSYSKSLSLPGERIGYVFVSPRADEASDVFRAVAGAGRALGYVCAPSLLQRLVAACVDKTSDISVYEANRRLLYDALLEYGYDITPPDGAFYLFVKSPTGSAKEFSDAAKALGLLLVPSDDFGFPGYVRIAYCQSRDMIRRSLPAFRELAKQFGLCK